MNFNSLKNILHLPLTICFAFGLLGIAVAAYSENLEYRRPFPLPDTPPGASIILYGPLPAGILGKQAEENEDWKPFLAKAGVALAGDDFALFYAPARILSVATTKKNHEALRILFE